MQIWGLGIGVGQQTFTAAWHHLGIGLAAWQVIVSAALLWPSHDVWYGGTYVCCVYTSNKLSIAYYPSELATLHACWWTSSMAGVESAALL